MIKNHPVYFKSKVTSVLSSLSSKDIRRIGEMIESPFFNKNKKIKQLFNALIKRHPNYSKVDKTELFSTVFGKSKPYNDGLLRALVSDLVKLIETYFEYSTFEKRPRLRSTNLLNALHQRRLYFQFEKRLNAILKKIETDPYKDANFYYFQFQVELESYRYTTITNNRAKRTSLQEVVDNLDIYYLAEKLKYSAIALNRQRIIGQYDLKLIDELLNYLERDPTFLEIPFIRLYHGVVLMLKDFDNDQYYYQFKADLQSFESELPILELRFLYTLLLNYARWKTYAGQNEFLTESFIVYQLILKKPILTEDNRISHHHYRNIVNIAIDLSEFEWAESFMDEYKEMVVESLQENVYAYNMAALQFAKKQFLEALDYLRMIQFSDVEFIDFYYHLYYKTLMIQTAFELSEVELLMSNLESFRLYLLRNDDIPVNMKSTYSNFIRLVRKLANIKFSFRKHPPELLTEIENTSPLINTGWLKDTVAQMN